LDNDSLPGFKPHDTVHPKSVMMEQPTTGRLHDKLQLTRDVWEAYRKDNEKLGTYWNGKASPWRKLSGHNRAQSPPRLVNVGGKLDLKLGVMITAGPQFRQQQLRANASLGVLEASATAAPLAESSSKLWGGRVWGRSEEQVLEEALRRLPDTPAHLVSWRDVWCTGPL
jgi:hypothetical protein